MVSSWLHYTKTHSNPVTTEHIRDRSRNPSATQVREGAGTMTSPPFMLKHKNVVYSALPHKWNIIICSELPLQINLLIPMLFKSSPETVCEQTCLKIIKTRQRSQYSKICSYPDLCQGQNKTMALSDKATKIYRLTRKEYDKMLNDSITARYKKASNNIKKKINATGIWKYFWKALKKRQANGGINCLISQKDHKENFQNNPAVCLINPAKNKLPKISKVILDKINKKT